MMTPNTNHSETEDYRLSGCGHVNAAKIVYRYLLDKNIKNTDSTWIALQNLIGFAAENALKAYLSSHGIKFAILKNELGHNLEKMLEKAVELGLATDGINHSQPELVAALNSYISLCGHDYLSFKYRYLVGDTVTALSVGNSTMTVLNVIECVLDIVEHRQKSQA